MKKKLEKHSKISKNRTSRNANFSNLCLFDEADENWEEKNMAAVIKQSWTLILIFIAQKKAER